MAFNRKKKVKKTKAENFKKIGVRFANSLRMVYTYRVKAKAKVYLGQELIVRNQYGTTIVYVTAIGSNVTALSDYDGPIKEITEKVGRL